MIRKVLKVFFILFWMVSIFSFSMDNGKISTQKSDGMIDRITEFFLRRELSTKEKIQYRNQFVIPIRKGAHLFLYFMLGFSVLFLLKEYGMISKRGIIISVCFVFLYACSDELHQLFVPERSGEITDVLLDTIGGLIGVIILYYYYYFRRRKNEQKETVS